MESMQSLEEISDDEYQRFHNLSAPVENVQEYRPGGYHPLYLGDYLQSARFVVLRKLGYGSYSTVWLAKDQRTSEFVALKVMKADCNDENEIKIYQRLAIEADHHPGRAHVMMLKEHFSIQGPNGTHRCHVHEIMGPSVATLMLDRVSGERFDEAKTKRFTLRAARAIIYQALLGLDFIHAKSLIHGDFYPANLLLSLRDFSKLGVEELRQSSTKVSAPVRRLDGKDDPRDPRFLTLDEPLREWVAAGSDFQVKISDLGSSFFSDSPPISPTTPVDVRSPELLFHNTISAAQDIWAFGCLIYLLLTGSSLFALTIMGSSDELDDEHILQLIALFGPLPEDLRKAWPRYRKYFDGQDVQTTFEVEYSPSVWSLDDLSKEDSDLDTDAEDLTEDEDDNIVDERTHYSPRTTGPCNFTQKSTQDLYPSLVEVYQRTCSDKTHPNLDQNDDIEGKGPISPPFSDRWTRDRYPDMASDESEAVADLLAKIFRYEPTERLTTREMLMHPWITGYCMGNLGMVS